MWLINDQTEEGEPINRKETMKMIMRSNNVMVVISMEKQGKIDVLEMPIGESRERQFWIVSRSIGRVKKTMGIFECN